MPNGMADWFAKELRRLQGTPEFEEAEKLLDATEGLLLRHPQELDAVSALTKLIDRAHDRVDDMEEQHKTDFDRLHAILDEANIARVAKGRMLLPDRLRTIAEKLNNSEAGSTRFAAHLDDIARLLGLDRATPTPMIYKAVRAAAKRVDVIVAVAVRYGSTGNVLLGRRGKGVEGPGIVGLPGGHLRRGELVEDCARREVEEETGITHLYNLHVVDVQDDHRPEDGICQPVIFFGGTTSQSPTNREPDKCDGWDWYPVDKLPPEEEMFDTLARFFKKLRDEG